MAGSKDAVLSGVIKQQWAVLLCGVALLANLVKQFQTQQQLAPMVPVYRAL